MAVMKFGPELMAARCGFAMVLAGVFCGAPAMAQDLYQLVAGDQIEISHIGAEVPVTVRVDMDGQIRLPSIGVVRVSGLTLDGTEDAIEAAIVTAGLFVDPKATVSVTGYAPVLITGDVGAPGRYDYVPHLTVATALGLSGGSRVTGVDSTQIARARADLAGQVMSLNQQITTVAVRNARFAAQVARQTTFTLDDAARAQIPAPVDAVIEALVADETLILENEAARAAELLALWDEEIASLTTQQDLLAQRITVSQEIAANFAGDLEAAKVLQQRGLQTNSTMSRVEQQDAESRSRVLELESALSTIGRSISESTRQRAQFLRTKRDDALQGAAQGRIALNELLLRHANALSEVAILADGNAFAMLQSDAFELEFTIVNDRPKVDGPVTMETRLLPGDALIVRLKRFGG